MKQTINFSQFCDAFKSMGRQDRFSYQGLRRLFEYLEEYEQDTGEEVELDVIALCCEYSEETLEELHTQYDFEKDGELVMYLQENTSVIAEYDDTLLYAAF